MGEVAAWIRTLMVVVLLGNLAEWLLPRADLRRYAGLVVGLFVLWAMAHPLVTAWDAVRVRLGAARLALPTGGTGPERDALIAQEEVGQIAAMVKTLPGVTDCTVTRSGSTWVVSVVFDRPESPGPVRAFVAAAVRLATGNPAASPTVRIVTRGPGEEGMGHVPQ